MGLSDLDDRLLPQWARRVQGARDAVVAAPTPAQALRGLDDRYAGAGALRVVRDAPVLGALVAVAVLLAATGTSVALSLSTAGAVAAAAGPVVLGPPLGADAEASLAAAHAAAVERARTAPGTRSPALVSLAEQLTVDEVAGLLVESTLEVRRAVVRAPVPGAELLTAEVAADPPRTLRALFAATTQRKSDQARDLTRQAASVPEGERASYQASAATAAREAAAYATDCACVLALLLEGTAAELAELPALPVVRGVELAPRGTAAHAVELRPLPPGTTGVVQ